MAAENVEDFYNAVMAAVRATLTRVSGETWIPRAASASLPEPRPRVAPFQPGYVGMRLVDITRLGDCLLIAFQWRETGSATYVYTVNLRSFAEGPYPVDVAEAIITMNLLERLGGNWYLHHPLIHIGGLAFMEEALSVSPEPSNPVDENQ